MEKKKKETSDLFHFVVYVAGVYVENVYFEIEKCFISFAVYKENRFFTTTKCGEK